MSSVPFDDSDIIGWTPEYLNLRRAADLQALVKRMGLQFPGIDAEFAEVDAFFEYAFTLHDAHCELASSTTLRLPTEDDSALVAQTRFCDRQLENVKTRRALERAFGPELTDRYMRRVLFDVTSSTPRSHARASSIGL